MGYYDHDDEDGAGRSAAVRPGLGERILGVIQGIVAVLVRLLGMGLVLVGLGIGISVVLEAWALYKAPDRIERFAEAIEQGSNIDSAFSSLASDAAREFGVEQSTQARDVPASTDGRSAPAAGGRSSNDLRLSYFAAWVIVLGLMLVVGMLAMSAASTGARLALAYGANRS